MHEYGRVTSSSLLTNKRIRVYGSTLLCRDDHRQNWAKKHTSWNTNSYFTALLSIQDTRTSRLHQHQPNNPSTPTNKPQYLTRWRTGTSPYSWHPQIFFIFFSFFSSSFWFSQANSLKNLSINTVQSPKQSYVHWAGPQHHKICWNQLASAPAKGMSSHHSG